MAKLVGYKKFVSKKGKEFCVANVVSPYTDRDIERDCVGSKVEEIFMPDNMCNFFSPSDIGRELDLSYEINGGRAYLCGVAFKK